MYSGYIYRKEVEGNLNFLLNSKLHLHDIVYLQNINKHLILRFIFYMRHKWNDGYLRQRVGKILYFLPSILHASISKHCVLNFDFIFRIHKRNYLIRRAEYGILNYFVVTILSYRDLCH